MAFLHQVRMPLLMVVAGVATATALERRSVGVFAVDRIKRLFVPLVFGMFVIVPPQIYGERVAHGAFAGSYAAFIDRCSRFSRTQRGAQLASPVVRRVPAARWW